MSWSILPPWSLYWIVSGGVLLVLLLGARMVRERRTVPVSRQARFLPLRGAFLVGLLVIALNPHAYFPRGTEEKPVLAILVDTSASMAVNDAPGGMSRIEAVHAALAAPDGLAALRRTFEVDVRHFDRTTGSYPLSGEATARGSATDIAGALYQTVTFLDDQPAQAGMVLMSDGRATTHGTLEAARLALAKGVPVWCVPLGGQVEQRDLWITLPVQEILAFEDDTIEVRGTLHRIGFPPASHVIEVRHGTELLAQVEVVPEDSGTASFRIPVQVPSGGEPYLEVSVPEEPGETDTANNRVRIALRRVGERVRVLFAEGEPHWDSKFLIQCLKRDPRIDLTAITRLGEERVFTVVNKEEHEHRESGDAFPRTAEEFAQYDVICFGRGVEPFFDEDTEGHLTEFVATQGGSLVFARGRPTSGRFLPLQKFEPLLWDEGAPRQGLVQLSGDWGDNPLLDLAPPEGFEAFTAGQPLLDRIDPVLGFRPLATVFATEVAGERYPVLVAQPWGQGRVVTLNAGGIWRWGFRGEEDEAAVYDRFWRHLFRWLLAGSDFSAGESVALRSDRRVYSDEQTVLFQIRTRGLEGYQPRLALTPEGGESMTLEPTARGPDFWRVEAGPFPPGAVEVVLTGNTGHPREIRRTIEIVSGSVEHRNLSADPEMMAEIARITGGAVLEKSGLGELPGLIQGWQTRQQLAEDRRTLWDRWPLFLAMILCFALEGYLRRREGLT